MGRAVVVGIALISFLSFLGISLSFPPVLTIDDILILLFLFLVLLLIDSFPLRTKHAMISLQSFILIAVFLSYGIVVETLMGLLSLLIVLTVRRKMSWYRFFLIQSMIIWKSLLAAAVYYILYPFYSALNIFDVPLIALLGYVVTGFVTNHLFLSMIRRFYDRLPYPLTWNNLKWDVYSTLLSFPLGLLLYSVHHSVGFTGILLVAVPILFVTYVFRLYHDLYLAHGQLKALNDLTTRFTAQLDLEHTLAEICKGMKSMVNVDAFLLFLKDEKDELVLVHHDGECSLFSSIYSPSHIIKNEPVKADDLIRQVAQDGRVYVDEKKSKVVVPMIWDHQTVGVICLAARRTFRFTDRDVTLIQILASQAAIALQNAQRFTQSERRSKMDELTGLYNYRTFDSMIHRMVRESEKESKPLSLLILDIDYFKQVNDRFGHLVGNDVLKHVAQIIQSNVRKGDIVSRYGGEEFTVLLPDTDQEEAVEIAERIRSAIQKLPLKVHQSLKGKGEMMIQVTASIGIATYPTCADSTMSLIRHADRAMYLGAKQSGRNKVSCYQ
ncbi:sensor domain-containing diguanylate cyclase [Microaerobacter geothermalis]|uniref:GGDEF domain-containing protein n=1 Tax=Microaerobacter geothermalis TaxID=674972 RepID=UPI001F3A3D2B|nr:sensor domain-containing diguanylate cyclase [Microaerobacter geothermalis]MCF6093400.1 sensor domain-containing diguanylate cyclase [Microaerobacter geothermalis]